ncbi:hypothetical protein [uncultured Psychroserpens sp.]|uniref:hypothetical protein n=1 Tax=uncultured Psychroserpens sp. TaxID=255436 RepID=UPI00261588D0|nr:hypothetical protein [uncultured Psychroserpens sp.]
MKCKFYVLIMTILLISCEAKSQNRIQINIPTVDDETDYIWRTIQDIDFFEQNGYQVSLPKGTYIELLKNKAKAKSLSDYDYETLKTFIKDSVYKKSDYKQGYHKIEKQRPLINEMVSIIHKSERNWDFKVFDIYQINLTLYGPGGSYNPDEGSILIYTTQNGQFKNYDNPANTIIHEITHIGIEESIIAKYNVPHSIKERIVDTFILLNFKAYLPNYRVQDMGEYITDNYLKTKADLKNLDNIVKHIMKSE